MVTHRVTDNDHSRAEARRELRSRWELACVLDFFNVFSKQLKPEDGQPLGVKAEELEDALIAPDERQNAQLLTRVHFVLLRRILSGRSKQTWTKARASVGSGGWAPSAAQEVARGWAKLVGKSGGEADSPPFDPNDEVKNRAIRRNARMKKRWRAAAEEDPEEGEDAEEASGHRENIIVAKSSDEEEEEEEEKEEEELEEEFKKERKEDEHYDLGRSNSEEDERRDDEDDDARVTDAEDEEGGGDSEAENNNEELGEEEEEEEEDRDYGEEHEVVEVKVRRAEPVINWLPLAWYKHRMSPTQRLRALWALCEMRLDGQATRCEPESPPPPATSHRTPRSKDWSTWTCSGKYPWEQIIWGTRSGITMMLSAQDLDCTVPALRRTTRRRRATAMAAAAAVAAAAGR